MVRRILVLATAVVLAGCAGATTDSPADSASLTPVHSAASPNGRPSSTPDTLDVAIIRFADPANPATLTVDTATGRVLERLPDGPVSPDGSTLYALRPIDRDTEVDALDPLTGVTTRYRTVPGRWALPTMGADRTPIGLASDGSVLVLTALDAPDGSSRFAVLSASLNADPTYVDLAGSFDVDGISPSGGTLFLVERRDGRDYAVRSVDVTSGRLDPQPVVDKREGGEAMVGTAIGRIVSTPWLHTLYQAQQPFLHSLDATNRFTLCVDLDPVFNRSHELALALTADGGLGWIVDVSSSRIAGINVEEGLAGAAKPFGWAEASPASTVAPASTVGPAAAVRFDPALVLDGAVLVGMARGLVRVDPAMGLARLVLSRPVAGLGRSLSGTPVAVFDDGTALAVPR